MVAQTVKNLPAMWETQVQSLGQEYPLEKGLATHSSIPAWRIPWKRSLAGYSLCCCKESDMTERISVCLSKEAKDLKQKTKTLMKKTKDDTRRDVMFFGWKNQYSQNDYIT